MANELKNTIGDFFQTLSLSGFWKVFFYAFIWVSFFFLMFSWALWSGVNVALMIAGLSVVGTLTIVICTTKLLIPYFFVRKRKKFAYVVLSLLLMAVMTYICVNVEIWILRYLEVPLKHELKLYYPVTKFVLLFMTAYVISNIVFFSKKFAEDAGKQEELLMEKKMLEMKMLKTQINSHFLFNALNNIYSMIYFKDMETSQYVLKLSQMMRYVIEDCEADYTPVEKEVEYIENFIEFQQIRFEAERDIQFTKSISNPSIKIPPMILQPIVENCFKHCPLDLDDKSFINIRLEVDEKQLTFIAKNTNSTIKTEAKERSSRIGLINIERRLRLIYKDDFSLKTESSQDDFQVLLHINFNENGK